MTNSVSNGVNYSAATGGIYADLAAQFAEAAPAGQGWSNGPGSVAPVSTDHFAGIQNVNGSAWDDLLVSGTLGGILFGGAGNDLLYGNTSQATADGASALTLDGGAGNNALYGSSGFNTFIAGDADGGFNQIWGAASGMDGIAGYANNTVSFKQATAGVYVDLLGGHNAYVGSAAGQGWQGTGTLEDAIANVPNVIGSDLADTIIAGTDSGRITGGAGADRLYAAPGAATTFVYANSGDSNLLTGYDTIMGFARGRDRIDLTGLGVTADNVVIASDAGSTSVYVLKTPGAFNAGTDLAISLQGANAVTLDDIDFKASSTFSPFVDMGGWGRANLVQDGQESGIWNYTLSFVVARNSSGIVWGGLEEPITADNIKEGTILDQVKGVQRNHGHITISFGGSTGDEPAVHAPDAQTLQKWYQSVIDRYGIDSIDFDLENQALGPQYYSIRDQALVGLEKANPNLKVSFTLPVMPTGLDPSGLNVLKDATANHVRIDTVNVMAMDYGASFTGDMGDYAISAAKAVEQQVAPLGIAHIGITPMIGVNDTVTETFTLDDARALVDYAKTDSHITQLGMWAMARDNGSHAGDHSKVYTDGSGIAQSTWQFSQIFHGFDHSS